MFIFCYIRAETLLDQYRKKSQLYRTNILFVQLGDDFRYTTMDEAKKQFENYDKLFTYMNQQDDLHVNVRFIFKFLIFHMYKKNNIFLGTIWYIK